MRLRFLCILSGLVFFSGFAFAADDAANIEKVINQRIQDELGSKADSIKPSVIKGLYEVVVGPRVFYLSPDGRYVIAGDVIDLQSKLNLTEAIRGKARDTALANLKEEDMIVFAPKGETKHTLTVFTDIDCGYCRKLHNEMSQYNDLGIKVRYMAFPRAGVNSPSYNKIVSVWCAKDKRAALTKAKNGGSVPNTTCDNPVKQQMQLGQVLGVTGTPALILENGQLYPGYAPADRLFQILEENKKPDKQAKAK